MGSHAGKSEGSVHSFTASTFNFRSYFRRKACRLLAAAFGLRGAVAALLVAVGSASAVAQSVQFFGSFQSYSQSMAQNAQGLVANASGNLYISGTSTVAYVPVDANGNPLSAGQTDIYVGATKVNSTAPPYSTADAMGLAIDSSNNLFRVDPTEALVQMFVYGGQPSSNFSYKALGSGWSKPSSVTVDSSSNVYVLDAGNGSIVKLMSDGIGGYTQTTLFTDPALLSTTGLSIDSAGNFYVASGSNYGYYSLGTPALTGVYKISNNGSGSYNLSTIGGGWVSPSATAADAAGNVWVVDYGANTINLLVPDGDGSFSQTVYQTIDEIRTLMVNQGGRIYGFAYDGARAAIWTGGTPPHNLGSYNVGTAAPTVTVTVDFMSPATVAAAGGFNVTTQGESTAEFQATGGTCANGTTYTAMQSCTVEVTFTPKAPGMRTGALVVTDGSGHVLGTNYFYGVGLAPSIAYNPGTFSTVIPNSSGLVNPSGVALDEAGNLYVTAGLTVSKFAAGSATSTFTDNTSQTSMGIAVDGAGNLWMAQPWAETILLKTLKSSGVYADSTPFGTGNPSGLYCPDDVAVDGSGNVYIADSCAGDVLKETLNNGSYVQSIMIHSLNNPSGVAVDSSGNVYVTDTGNHQVLEETPSGSSYIQTTVATGLNSPQRLAIDPNGNVYISDSLNAQIVKATPSGATFVQSALLTTGMTLPVGLALDAAGDLYIDDQDGQTIDELNVSATPSFAFAPTFAGSESSDNPKSATFFNYGNADLNISTISMPSGFSSDASTCALSSETLAANTACILGMDFTPTLGVPYSGNVVLTDNNLNLPATMQTIELSGTGLPNVLLSPASETLSPGIVGVAYSQNFPADGGSSPYSYVLAITNGTMPAGLNFSGGVLSGTPSATGSVTFSIIATDSSASPGPYSSGSQSYSLTVNAAFVLNISPGLLPDGAVGIPYSQTVTASGGSASYHYAVTSGSFPAWLSLNAVTGVLSGTPTVVGPISFTISATDTIANVTASQGYAATIYAVASAAPTQSAGSSNIGSPASTTTLTFTFTIPASVASINVVTQGIPNKDFTNAGSGTCVAMANSANNTCTVDVTFTPQAAGIRYGAVLLEDGLGDVLGTGYVSGTGTGPQITFQPGTEITLATAGSGFHVAQPAAIAVDAGGNLYVPDFATGPVYKETLSGGSYTQSIVAALDGVGGVALDGAGNVYIARGYQGTIYKETLSGNNHYTESVISSNAGYPYGIAVDGSGNVFVADPSNNVIYELMLSAGNYAQSTIISNGLNMPNGIAVDASGNLYIADTGDPQVWKETLAAGTYSASAIGSALQGPEGVLVDGSGNVYIADINAGQVLKETWSGDSYTQSVVPTGSQMSPYGIAMDATGNLFIADITNGRVLKEDYADQPSLDFAETTKVGSADTENPLTVTLLNSGNAPLIFPAPAIGTNPAIVNGSFTIDSASSCTPVGVGGTAGSLAAGASCTYAVDFTPQVSGANSGTLTLQDNYLNNASAAQPITLFGTGVAPVITLSPVAGTLTAGRVDLAYSQSFTASGGSGPYTFVSSGALPAGLLLSAGGVLTGTPTTTGSPWSFSVTATDTISGSQVSQGYALSIEQGTATITLGGLSQTYSGSPLTATATTSPASLALSLSYSQEGSPVAVPSSAGSYAVTATITDPNYTGTVIGAMTISKAAASVTLAGLSQTYSGFPLAAAATTNPASLSVSFTYNASSTAPSAAGSFAVIGTITDPNYRGTASGTLVIGAATTAVTVAASANPAALMSTVTVTAAVSSAAETSGGQVSFLDGTTPLGSAAVSGGVATFTTAALATGAHSITATYMANANLRASSSSPLSLTVVDLSLGNSGGGGGSTGQSQTTFPGGSASYSVALAPSAGTTFPSPIILFVTGLPVGATATLGTSGWTEQSPTTWALPANQPVSNIMLKFQMPAQMAAIEPRDWPVSKLRLLAAGLLLLPFARKWRKGGKRMSRWLCLLVIAGGVMAAMGTTGCGDPSSPPQTYNLIVTVTAGVLTHSTPLTLTVK